MNFLARNPKLFVLYYHQILPKWGFDKSYKTFDLELKFLKSNFNIITPDDIYEYLTTDRRPDKTSVCITFDDGMLDNYTYAYPLLKKHQIKATLFVPPSRILKEDIVRPSLEDYWNNKTSFQELHQPLPLGTSHRHFFEGKRSTEFLSVTELNKINDFFQVECHAMVHARSFHQDEIIDFHDGTNGHYSDHHSYQEAPQKGFPLFPRKNNIAVQAGLLKTEVKEHISSKPQDFFENKNWKQLLKEEITTKFPARLDFETLEDQKQRITNELVQSKEELEAMIGRKVNYFSYPFGDHAPVTNEICSKIFKASFTTQKDIIRKNTPLHQIPRGSIAKDFFSFVGRVIKFNNKK